MQTEGRKRTPKAALLREGGLALSRSGHEDLVLGWTDACFRALYRSVVWAK